MARKACPTVPRHLCSTPEQIAALLHREERNRTGLFWAEGCRSFFSALENRWLVQQVVYCPSLIRSGWAFRAILKSGLPRMRISEEQFRGVSARATPDGVGIVCAQHWTPLIDVHPVPKEVWVALDSVRFPGNLGTIFRTCAAVGARGVMLIGGEADPFDLATIRASMGALFAVDLVRTSAKALAGWKARRDVTFIGASPNATLDYRACAYRKPLVLMMGSERTGLRERQLSLCDQTVRLPMTDRVDSLNLATATSVLLYEATR